MNAEAKSWWNDPANAEDVWFIENVLTNEDIDQMISEGTLPSFLAREKGTNTWQ